MLCHQYNWMLSPQTAGYSMKLWYQCLNMVVVNHEGVLGVRLYLMADAGSAFMLGRENEPI